MKHQPVGHILYIHIYIYIRIFIYLFICICILLYACLSLSLSLFLSLVTIPIRAMDQNSPNFCKDFVLRFGYPRTLGVQVPTWMVSTQNR